MDFQPQKLFIGLMDFFTILLPGALLTFVLKHGAGAAVLGNAGAGLTETAGWAVFLFVSYLLGHLVFLIASWFDDAYDSLRGCTLNDQITMLADRDRLLWFVWRGVIWLIFKRDRNQAVKQAGRLRQTYFKDLGIDGAINTFQWSKLYLTIKNSPSLSTIQRLEADSKFFRSFMVVMILIFVSWGWQEIWPDSGLWIVVALFLMAGWRYMEQRFKAIRHAYWSVIAHAADAGIVRFEPAPPVAGSAAGAGGVVFRSRRRLFKRDCETEYLLVQARDRRDAWVLPMATADAGEPLRETAIRGVYEETGVWAVTGMRLRETRPPTAAAAEQRRQRNRDANLGEITVRIGGKTVLTRFFLMQQAGWGWRTERSRRRQWLTLQEAIDLSRDVDTRDLLLAASTRRRSLSLRTQRSGSSKRS